jgi:uncharacterized protein (TIGR03000 family)
MPTEAIPSDARREVRKGVLSVNVPEGAKVLVNGMTTQSTGSQRRYVSHGLKPGHSYRYEVTTVVEKDGQSVEETKTAVLRAGQVARLDFGSQSDDVRTSLTLNVPEDAKVFLSGSPTTSQGEVRRFSTQRISEGEKWQDYVVRVEVERNGHTLSKEQPVTLAGGDQLELDFSFADAELASNR